MSERELAKSNNEFDKVWLITGCSSGMGRDIALEALSAGYRVVVSARKPSTLEEILDRYPDHAHAVQLMSPSKSRSKMP